MEHAPNSRSIMSYLLEFFMLSHAKSFVKYTVCSSLPQVDFLTNTFLPDFVKKANIVWKIFSFS